MKPLKDETVTQLINNQIQTV